MCYSHYTGKVRDMSCVIAIKHQFKFQDVTSAHMKPGISSKDMSKQKPKVPKPVAKRKSTRPHVEIEYEYEPAVTTEKSKTSC
jgi:hypothetical protein